MDAWRTPEVKQMTLCGYLVFLAITLPPPYSQTTSLVEVAEELLFLTLSQRSPSDRLTFKSLTDSSAMMSFLESKTASVREKDTAVQQLIKVADMKGIDTGTQTNSADFEAEWQASRRNL
jgi:hypothetical protein